MTKIPDKPKPKITSRQPITDGRLYDFESVGLTFQNGQQRQFMRIKARARSAVLVVPMLDEHTFLLIREYGAGIEDYYLGFPKGALELDEDVLLGANRELQEEAGYGARDLSLVKTFTTSPSYMTSTMHFVLAQDLYPSQLEGDEPEPLDVFEWKIKDIDSLLARDDFHEARSIAAVLWMQRMFS